jgi:nucleotide-binding universal stress UspA family protein
MSIEKIQKVLFPTDFSPASDAVLRHATALARGNNATLLIVHVEEPPLAYGSGELFYGVSDFSTESLQKLLNKIVPPDPAVPVVRRLVMGDPATEIPRVAKEENVDLIVMGTHGRTGLKRLLMGSVAELVVRRAPCAVLTVRQPESETAETPTAVKS